MGGEDDEEEDTEEEDDASRGAATSLSGGAGQVTLATPAALASASGVGAADAAAEPAAMPGGYDPADYSDLRVSKVSCCSSLSLGPSQLGLLVAMLCNAGMWKFRLLILAGDCGAV
jgi:hypothetical protein